MIKSHSLFDEMDVICLDSLNDFLLVGDSS